MIKEKTSKLNKSLGVIHIHSVFSDGTGDICAITKAAKAAGLDWIIVTDHNNMDIQEGFINDVCVIKGQEISPKHNHYLAFGVNKLVNSELSAQEYVQEVRKQGGIGFAAHPDEASNRKNAHRPIKWLDKFVNPDGIEIWNWFSTWADNYSDKNIFTLAYSYLLKHRLITKPKKETLSWWDELNNNSENIVPAIGGVDAHSLKVSKYLLPVTIFPYKSMFKTITNVLYLEKELSSDFDEAKEQILGAIRCGNNLIVNRKLCKEIPEIYVANKAERVFSGDKISCDENTIINIKLGKSFDVRLLKDGELVWNKQVKTSQICLSEQGKYRIEIGLGKLGYAYTNPITVQ